MNANNKAIDDKFDDERLTKHLIASQRRMKRENEKCTRETLKRDIKRLSREDKLTIGRKVYAINHDNETIIVKNLCHYLCNAKITLNPPLESCPRKA